MAQNKKYIIANWKANPVSFAQARKLLKEIPADLEQDENIELVVCPPHIFLCLVSEFPNVKFGAQNIFWEDEGSYTGEVSGAMVKNLGGEYSIIGHSERRKYFNETDGAVNIKIQACLKNKLKPIICVGEKEKDQEEELKKQLETSLSGIKKTQLKNIIIVYEPVWAISTYSHGVAASPDDALAGLLFIRKLLVKAFGQNLGKSVKVVYGGSVNSKNVSVFVNQVGFDGALVGNASLRAKEFCDIIKIVKKNQK